MQINGGVGGAMTLVECSDARVVHAPASLACGGLDSQMPDN
jgi:hypothetical protein